MKMIKRVLGFGLLASAMSANAALDVTAVTGSITDAGTAVATIGAAVTILTVGISVYKWIRRAL